MRTGKGWFIVIDGGNGSGKETQCKLLIERLQKEDFEIAYADFPQYEKPSCFFVEKYLNKGYGHPNEVGPYRASIFFAVDRYDDSARIRKELAEGKIIVSNRYVSANIGHQGGKIKDEDKRNKFLDWLLDFEFNVMKIPRPDLTIFLHVPPYVGDTLVEKKEERTRTYIKEGRKDAHEADPEHNKNAEEAYLYAAKKYGWPTIECVVDGTLESREEIHKEVWKVVEPLLYKQ